MGRFSPDRPVVLAYLISRPEYTVKEIAELSGVSESTVYAVAKAYDVSLPLRTELRVATNLVEVYTDALVEARQRRDLASSYWQINEAPKYGETEALAALRRKLTK